MEGDRKAPRWHGQTGGITSFGFLGNELLLSGFVMKLLMEGGGFLKFSMRLFCIYELHDEWHFLP